MPEQSITPTVFYTDPKTAMAWLERAFGFETAMVVTDETGQIGHAEMTYGGAAIGIGGEWSGAQLGPAAMKSPASLAGAGTQFIWVRVAGDIDAHCAHAQDAGARITQHPADQFFGARTYRALDPEGHVWNFRKEGPAVSTAEMERATGLKISNKL